MRRPPRRRSADLAPIPSTRRHARPRPLAIMIMRVWPTRHDINGPPPRPYISGLPLGLPGSETRQYGVKFWPRKVRLKTPTVTNYTSQYLHRSSTSEEHNIHNLHRSSTVHLYLNRTLDRELNPTAASSSPLL